MDEWTGYRYYNIAQMQRLNTIRGLQRQGFTLEEIKELLEDGTQMPSIDLLTQKIVETEQQLQLLMERRRQLLKWMDSHKRIKKMEKFSIQYLPEIIVASHREVITDYTALGPLCVEKIGPEMQRLGCKLYISPRLKSFPALLLGGGQESGYRSGTEATPAIFGFAAACAAVSSTFRQDVAREKELIDTLVERISAIAGVKINGAHQAPHILSLSIPGVPTQNTINLLQDAGICVSAGSACAKGHRSHTLTAIGLDSETMDSSFRVSISRETTDEDVQALLNGLLSVLDWIKR